MQSLKEFSIYTKRVLGTKDSYAIKANANALGIDDKMLVENAGSAISHVLLRKHRRKRILFVCGSGGKGAIGLSTARHLLDFPDINVSIAFLGNGESVHNDVCSLNYRLLNEVIEIVDIDEGKLSTLRSMSKSSDVIVEAIIGLGLRGKLYGLMAHAIKIINESRKHIVSLDVPAGIDADTGAPNLSSIKPTHVLTLHKLKTGIEKSRMVSSTTVEKIGIPVSAELLAGPGDLIVATESRLLDANKYSHGSVLVVGGSEKYRSAPLLASASASEAVAALRVGAGYVTVMLPSGIDVPREGQYANIISRNFKRRYLSEDDIPTIGGIKHNVLLIGGGIDESETSYRVMNSIISQEKKLGNIIIADAAAAKAVAKSASLMSKNIALTPHLGEFKSISGIDLSGESLKVKVNAAVNFAKDKGCVLVLKGNYTIITDGTLLKINKAATAALATMGTGDVLSGIIAAYASSHKNVFESAVAGVYLHSKIADILHMEKGDHITAMDVIEAIPSILRAYDRPLR
ncbi:MAG: NAD(P)H-hydrate dehydratase [Candidatus Micrarchaeaceae archaeon]